MTIDDLTIVVCCTKRDFFMAKICVASIRYYYPGVRIELVKDEGNGKFRSKELETNFNVSVVDLKVKNLGMCGAKFHYLYLPQRRKKVLLLDPDIVFIGPFVDRLLPAVAANDYVVSCNENDISDTGWVTRTYFDMEMLRATYPAYKYPGYFFNCGQLFLTTGSIEEKYLDEFFNPHEYPYWKNRDLFHLYDQSIYNYLLPTLEAEKKLKLGKEKFMIWAGDEAVSKIKLADIEQRILQSGLIHWAGCLRFTPASKMIRGDILQFFESFYYSRVKRGRFKQPFRTFILTIEYHLKQVYYKLKRAR